jgi:hypothetical protein
MPYETFRSLVIDVFEHFREQGYMQEAFGYECVVGDRDGTLGSNPSAFFMRSIMRPDIWPYWAEIEVAFGIFARPYESWDADCLFDVVEVLHDLVAKPIDGTDHSHRGCGWHYHAFEQAAGRREFRREMNGILRMHDPPYEMNNEGLVVEATPDAFHPLLSAAVPEGTEAEVISKLDAAIARFRTRGASIDDRRTAVRDLADVLEALRADMRDTMLPKDERDLFHIANGFAIRHQNREQRGDYDRGTWLRWSFYVYLATIHAVLRVRNRASELPPTPTS